MNKDVRKLLREIDTVTVKGSIKPMRLYTIDVDEDEVNEVADGHLKISNSDKRRMLERERFVVWQALKNRSMSTLSLYRSDGDFIELRCCYDKQLHKLFQEAYSNYKEGKWPEAKELFEEVIRKNPKEGPSKTLLRYMGRFDFKAPADWKGYRALTEK